MSEYNLTDVIATRILEVDGEPRFEIRLWRPVLAKEGDCWFCYYEIKGPQTSRKGKFGGEDSMQALVNALYCASVETEISAENQERRLSWYGDKNNFGLPSPVFSNPEDK